MTALPYVKALTLKELHPMVNCHRAARRLPPGGYGASAKAIT